MTAKPTYEELVQRVKELEKEKAETNSWKRVSPPAWESPLSDFDSISKDEIILPEMDLASIINVEEIQSIMNDFWYLTRMVTAILDLDGNVLESTGWQDICTQFHRVHPQTAKNCTESDLFLAKTLQPGEYAEYKCQNGLWDVVTPLYVGNKHFGNIFTGQFFYDDEQVDKSFFVRQARQYGFDEDEYMEAFSRVPRYSREQINRLMSFLVKFTTYISGISLVNAQLEKEVIKRKKAQEAEKKSQALLQSVIKTIPDLIWLKDPEGVFLFCNSRIESLYGAKQADIIGKTDYDFVDKELADFFRKRDKIVMDEGVPVKNEEEVVFAEDGHRELLETVKAPMFNRDGKLVGVLGIGRDITERKRAEQEKIRLEEQYHQAQKVESIGRLAGGVAHDLNNLLSPVLGYSELLIDDLKPDDPRRESVGEILKAGLRARDLVRQLLAFSRKQTLEYKPVNINATVAGFKNLLRRTIREDIEIKISASPDICNVMADIGQIEQVLMNLAVNAADAMSQGGILNIETSLVFLDENYAKLHENAVPGQYVMMAISDNGTGIDKETLPHIFDPFYTTKGVNGTGLGLSTVYGIVKQHGGNVWVYSEPGVGTTFKVYLPASDKVHLEENAQQKRKSDLSGTQNILLVEDNDQVRNLAKNILTRLGYSVFPAKDGLHALETIEKQEFPMHLLLTDVIMPGMNGRELYSKIVEAQPNIKVLYMSGYTGNVIAHHGILDEGITYIQKPFNVHGLASKVREVLDSDP